MNKMWTFLTLIWLFIPIQEIKAETNNQVTDKVEERLFEEQKKINEEIEFPNQVFENGEQIVYYTDSNLFTKEEYINVNSLELQRDNSDIVLLIALICVFTVLFTYYVTNTIYNRKRGKRNDKSNN